MCVPVCRRGGQDFPGGSEQVRLILPVNFPRNGFVFYYAQDVCFAHKSTFVRSSPVKILSDKIAKGEILLRSKRYNLFNEILQNFPNIVLFGTGNTLCSFLTLNQIFCTVMNLYLNLSKW